MKEKAKRTERMTYAQRKGVGKLHVNLSDADKEKFQHRWTADYPGKVAEREAMGYERVTHSVEGGAVRHGGSHEDGKQMKKVLMRIPREFYDEDQAAKRDEHQELMDRIEANPMEREAQGEISSVQQNHGKMVQAQANLEIG